MCAKKLKYAAGDDLMLFATPKESMEASKKELEEKERWKRVVEENERLKRLAEEQQWMAGRGSVNGYGNAPNINGNRIVSAPPGMIANGRNSRPTTPSTTGFNVDPNSRTSSNSNRSSYGGYGQPVKGPGSSPTRVSPTQKRHRPPPILQRQDGIPLGKATSPPAPNLHRNHQGQRPNNDPQKDINVAIQLFHNHDVKRRSRLTGEELQNLLQNDDNTRFCMSSIDSIIDFFGLSRFGTVNQNEFISLYQKIKHWRKVYVDNDIDHSYSVNSNEYHNCLQELKYIIPVEVSKRLFDQFAEFNVNTNVNNKELKFDRFVESLLWIMKLTKMFRKFDANQQGIANISYKDFIETTLYLGRFLSQ